jgi:hypothetical protein
MQLERKGEIKWPEGGTNRLRCGPVYALCIMHHALETKAFKHAMKIANTMQTMKCMPEMHYID